MPPWPSEADLLPELAENPFLRRLAPLAAAAGQPPARRIGEEHQNHFARLGQRHRMNTLAVPARRASSNAPRNPWRKVKTIRISRRGRPIRSVNLEAHEKHRPFGIARIGGFEGGWDEVEGPQAAKAEPGVRATRKSWTAPSEALPTSWTGP